MPRIRPTCVFTVVSPMNSFAAISPLDSPRAISPSTSFSAETVASHVESPVDVVVSGLPWTAMPAERQQSILDAVMAVLSPYGRFTTFAYAHTAWTPPARRFAASLRSRFAVVERTPVVWQNLPPAFVYRAALPVLSGRNRYGQPAAAAA